MVTHLCVAATAQCHSQYVACDTVHKHSNGQGERIRVNIRVQQIAAQ
jgi:hypothetical protein